MIIITGWYNAVSGIYRMRTPDNNDTVLYVGYTEKQMKSKYRLDFHLRYKHIDWIII